MNQTTLTIGSIIIGAALVAGAIFIKDSSDATPTLSLQRAEAAWIYGDEDAEITIVEFSDVECPFCARIHPTLERLVDESDGRINWEYRHLPLPMHRNAELGAAATECVGEQLGNDAFWVYLARLLVLQGQHSLQLYEQEAITAGVEIDTFSTCLTSAEIQNRINLDRVVAQSNGGSGTPFNVIQFADGTTKPVSGALPYAQWQALLNN